MTKNFKLIRKLNWEEVFSFWYQNEGLDKGWQALAKKNGFASWADWRLKAYAQPFECSRAKWGLYEVSKAPQTVSGFYGGPFKAWQEHYYAGAKTRTFAELVTKKEILTNPKIKDLIKKYPATSIIIALELKDGKIFVIEGTHRACALAALAKNNKSFPKKLIFAIGQSRLRELPNIGYNKR